MSTKEEPGPFDGLERAQPGEPVFTLRAHDPLAADLVQLWVDRRRKAIGAADLPDDRRAVELVQAADAERIAWAMRDWRDGVAEVAALPTTSVPIAYSGHKTEADELAAKARFDAHRHASRRFDNAVAEVCEAADSLGEYAFDREGVDIAAGLIRIAAENARPKRASYAHRGGDDADPS